MMATMASPADAALPATEREDDHEPRESPRQQRRFRIQGAAASRDRKTSVWDDRTLTLEVAAREWMWLYDHRHGMSLAEIAGYEGLSIERVQFGVERSAAQEAKASKDDLIECLKSGRLDDVGFRLIPLFPIGAFIPQSTCPHHDSIGRGSRLCCMVCHASGMDEHPGLRGATRLTDPLPEPKPAPAPDGVGRARPGRQRRLASSDGVGCSPRPWRPRRRCETGSLNLLAFPRLHDCRPLLPSRHRSPAGVHGSQDQVEHPVLIAGSRAEHTPWASSAPGHEYAGMRLRFLSNTSPCFRE